MARTSKPAAPRTIYDRLGIPPYRGTENEHYFYITLRPWPSLVFILPILIAFELGLALNEGRLHGGSSQLVAAYLIERMVMTLGAGRFGFLFPGLAVVAILLACHLVARQPWKFDPFVIPGMLGESLFWTVPLFVSNRVLHQAVMAGANGGGDPWMDQIIRGLGAGLYEELVFRLILITGLDILLINVLRFPRSASRVFAVLLSAGLFAAQHHPPLGAEPFDLPDFIFRTAAGIYLASLFIFRGFGIAAGCHAFYNALVVTASAVSH